MSEVEVASAKVKPGLSPALTLLAESDFPALYRFELDNRTWFEQSIEGRGDEFYSPEAVSAHLAECLEAYRQGTMYPGIIKDHRGEILGRANLHGIHHEAGNAYVGYRIARDQVGRGLATRAVTVLLQQAYDHYHLEQLTAFAATDNRPSVRILEKHGFELVDTLKELVEVQSVKKDCFKFVHRAAPRHRG